MPRKILINIKKYTKVAARELVPPIFIRIISSAIPVNRREGKTLSIKSCGKKAATLTSGRTLRHRGSKADLGVIRDIFTGRDFDLSRLKKRFKQIQRFYDSCAEPMIIDCGANIGASCVWFAHEYPRAKILAVEPDSDNFQLLTQNCEGDRVIGFKGAIASKPGTLALLDPGNGEWGYRTSKQDANAVENVRAYSIDELLQVQPGTPFILKIDIEGFEKDLFDDPSSAINRFPIVIIELHDWMLPGESTSKPFLKWHVSENRDFVHIGENVFSISNDILSS